MVNKINRRELVWLLLFRMGNFIPQWDTTHRRVCVLLLYWNDPTGVRDSCLCLLFSSPQCLQKLLPSASFRSSFPHRNSTKLNRHISEVHDSVSRSSHPPSSGPGTHPHLPVDQPLCFLALYSPQSAARLLAEQLLKGLPNVPSVPCPACPDNSPNIPCTCFLLKSLWT